MTGMRAQCTVRLDSIACCLVLIYPQPPPPSWNFVQHLHDIFSLSKLLLPLTTSIYYPSPLYLVYVITRSPCLDKVIRTRRRQSVHPDRFQITAPAVLSAALPTQMKIGHRSLILRSADVFRTVLLNVTTVSYLPDPYSLWALYPLQPSLP
jgi:hypothetical protein